MMRVPVPHTASGRSSSTDSDVFAEVVEVGIGHFLTCGNWVSKMPPKMSTPEVASGEPCILATSGS